MAWLTRKLWKTKILFTKDSLESLLQPLGGTATGPHMRWGHRNGYAFEQCVIVKNGKQISTHTCTQHHKTVRLHPRLKTPFEKN